MPGIGVKNQWQAPVMNFAGLAIFEEGFPTVPTGDYEVDLIESEAWIKKGSPPGSGPTSIVIRAKIASGPEKGKTVASWPGLTPNEGGARSWKAIYLSVGADANALESAFAPSWEHLGPVNGVPKRGYVHVEAAPVSEANTAGGDNNVDVIWLRKETYMARMAANAGGSSPMSMGVPGPMSGARTPAGSFPGFGVPGGQPGMPGAPGAPASAPPMSFVAPPMSFAAPQAPAAGAPNGASLFRPQ